MGSTVLKHGVPNFLPFMKRMMQSFVQRKCSSFKYDHIIPNEPTKQHVLPSQKWAAAQTTQTSAQIKQQILPYFSLDNLLVTGRGKLVGVFTAGCSTIVPLLGLFTEAPRKRLWVKDGSQRCRDCASEQ